MSKPSPVGALLGGLGAGAVGVAGLDLVQLWRYRRAGGDQPTVDWELSRGVTWAEAPAPAQVGRRAVEGIFIVELPDRWAPLMNDATHWGYGIAWGGLFGLVAGSMPKVRLRHGLCFGTFVWLVGYVILPLAKLYRPLWKYDPATLGGTGQGILHTGSVAPRRSGSLIDDRRARRGDGRHRPR
jgi:hypothetical protein